ncbi:hypothetical protein BU23DRAFT_630661 [Bimuria novae-zelandiae CBS 107.79]|uniref:Uncharacterized protein n=1 Tax=Bimuria novae-zelandiae CBS 107.79 TaxID=1447943 RepID=A0A6A5UL30_9PLEO|nr:hypothetical protein BU23DRAFT_630661 [Bimuria novae-zelandiae CBS 107.79]
MSGFYDFLDFDGAGTDVVYDPNFDITASLDFNDVPAAPLEPAAAPLNPGYVAGYMPANNDTAGQHIVNFGDAPAAPVEPGYLSRYMPANNGTAGQYVSSPLSAPIGLMDLPDEVPAEFLQPVEEVAAGPSNSSSSLPAESSSPYVGASTEPSSPAHEEQQLDEPARRVYESFPEDIRRSVGWAPELNRMLTEHPEYIPTFNWDSAMTMTAREVVNPVSGPVPAALAFDHPDLVALRGKFYIPPNMTVEQLAAMDHVILDKIADHPVVADVLEQYRYQPRVSAETLETILPNVGKQLNEHPELLEYYQIPLWPGQKAGPGEEEPEPEPMDESDDGDDADDEDEDEDPNAASKNKGKAKKKDKEKKLETKYRPRKVQYAPYAYRFKTAEEARIHRKKSRHPAKQARDIDRVEKYGRYYWTKRIYEAMINIDLIFDNKASVIAANFSKLHHFKEEDLEATAHAVFDAAIRVHREGWCGYDYNRRHFKRGKLRDVFAESIEGRLERICGILKHSKALANDCIQGGDLLQQTVDNPIYRASTKTANNKGNLDRADRLKRQETTLQRERRLKKEAEKAEKEAEKERKKRAMEEKKAQKEAEKALKQAEKEAAQRQRAEAAAKRQAAAAARRQQR